MPDGVLGRPAWLAAFSPGASLILVVALISTLLLAGWSVIWPTPPRRGLELWTFAANHHLMYRPLLEEHAARGGVRVDPLLLSGMVLQRRMLAAFLYDTPVAHLMEVERGIVGQAFSGPEEAIGFRDLTDQLRATRFEGKPLIDQINGPSFLPWTNRGRIYGIPHDVHPVVLAYRADIVESAGIDVSRIRTWDDFERITRPLREDFDGDGRPDRYPINLSETASSQIEALVLQAGGGYFDADMRPTVNSEVNIRVAARLVRWIAGPDAIAGDAPEFSDTGNQLRIRGFVVFSIAPDWLLGVWKQNIADLAGKLKVMPMPAWEPGGRRTSVVGGTMLGFPRSAGRFEEAWDVGLMLYTDREVARELFETNVIISPIKALWEEPFYREPDPYFSNQRVGEALISLAGEVPPRYTHPESNFAAGRYLSAIQTLKQWAEARGEFDESALARKARELLDEEQALVVRKISHNAFLAEQARSTRGGTP